MITRKRESYYRQLADLTEGERPAIVVLNGGPGWGKTTTLLEVKKLLSHSGSSLPIYLPFDTLCFSPEFFISNATRLIGEQIREKSAASAGKFQSIAKEGHSDIREVFRLLIEFSSDEEYQITLLVDEVNDLNILKSFPEHGGIVEDVYSLIQQGNLGITATTAYPGRIPSLDRISTKPVEYMEIPLLDVDEIEFILDKRKLQAATAPLIHSFTQGVPGYVFVIMDQMANAGKSFDINDLIKLMKPDAALEMKCRYNYEYLVQRSRGEGIVRHLLSVLAEIERPKLTEVAEVLGRSLGVTKDYLKWLLAVGLIEVDEKKYSIRDRLLALWIRLYRSGRQPSEKEIREKVGEVLQGVRIRVVKMADHKKEPKKEPKPVAGQVKEEESPSIILPRKQDIEIEELD